MRQYSEGNRDCQPGTRSEVYARLWHACQRGLDRALDRLFPPTCLLCLDPGHAGLELCAPCLADLPLAPPGCGHCALPAPAGPPICSACLAKLPSYSLTISAFDYDFPVDALVRGLKYGGRLAHARLLGTLLGRACAARSACVDGLVPVPLHRTREAARGYNQALEIARFVAAETGTALLDGRLRRVRATAAQAGLGALERRRNVSGAFRADRSFTGRRLALVDDVLTTGSTVEAAAQALRAAGAARVEVWVVARAAPPRGGTRDPPQRNRWSSAMPMKTTRPK